VTEGVLLRFLETDPLLSEYDAIILDEVHEHSIA
jgi:HrpA-like RNA helicase